MPWEKGAKGRAGVGEGKVRLCREGSIGTPPPTGDRGKGRRRFGEDPKMGSFFARVFFFKQLISS